MIRRLLLMTALGVYAIAAGCGRSGTPEDGTISDDDDGDDDDGGSPYFGSGSDGDVTLSVGTNRNPCVSLLTTDVGAGTVQLGGPATPFAYDDLVFLWQVQAPTGNAIGDTSAGATLVTTSAGIWELVRVSAIVGSSLSFSEATAYGYVTDTGRRAEACHVPEFRNVVITGSNGEFGGADWNSRTGAFVGFLVSGTLTMGTSAEVEIGGDGFAGAPGALGATVIDITTETVAAGSGGGKGEGIDRASLGLLGRGHLANGAGGGNGDNGGGGGGGSGGRGGYGGYQFDGAGLEPGTGGRPGVALPEDLPVRLYSGGGGGAGHANNTANTAGGRGGGVVLLLVNEIQGAGDIDASGEAGGPASQDGASGGGAGGTILLWAESGSYAGRVGVRGGNGGNSTGGGLRGPGGGGAGGRLAIHGAAFAGAIIDTGGGVSGMTGSTLDQAWGATAGDPGIRVDLLVPIPVPTPIE